VDAAEHNARCLRRVLESSLPPDALSFAEQHAHHEKLDLLSSVQALMLLPPESIQVLRQELVAQQILSICDLPGDTHYSFEAEPDPSGLSFELRDPVDPLSLIVACILKEPALDRARRSVNAFRDAPLRLMLKKPIDSSKLTVVCRLWLARLERASASYAQLLRLKPTEADQLTALVYALLITGQAQLRATASEQPRPMHHSRVPRSISSQALRPAKSEGLPTPGLKRRSSRPPEHHSQAPIPSLPVPPRSTLPPSSKQGPVSPRSRVQRECDAEARVAQAWMLGEADSRHLEKSRNFIAKVVKLFPRNPRIRYCYARLQKRAREYDSAIEEFARVAELDPNHGDARQDLDQLLEWRRKQRRSNR
jgi:tetratricopeptide (TPR) repeat protein